MATIALDATYAVDLQPSGVLVYSRRLIEALAELNSDHHFLVCYRLSRWRRHKEFLRFTLAPPGGVVTANAPARHKLFRRAPNEVETRGGYKVRSAGGPKGLTFSTRLFQEPWTFWLPRQAELFHSLAQRPAPFRFRKEIVTIHDVFPLTGRHYSTPDFQRKFSGLLRQAAERAARVITPSQYTARELVRHAGVPEEKIRVIPEGVDLPGEWMPCELRLRERERWVGKGNELLLIVGAVQTRKNTLGALRALQRLPGRYRLVLAGGKGHGGEAADAFIREQGLDGRVIRPGPVSRQDLAHLYQTASLLLFPSFEEGFGLPVLEAMASGLPVVTSRTSSLPEVGGAAALYADPYDDEDMATKVLQASEDPKLREQMIQTGLARAREFTWRRAAERTLDVYEEVLRA